MPLHAPGNFGERILGYGGHSSGKTTAWMGIADLALKTKSPAHFHVIDNDNATGRLIQSSRGSFQHLQENTSIYIPTDMDDYEPITERILNDVQEEDWIILDMLSNTWEGMPDWWHTKVFGESSWDYYQAVRRDIVEAAKDDRGHEKQFGGDAGVDWQWINKTYRAWEKQITIKAPCHVFATSSESEIQERYDKSGEQRAMYEIASGFAPKTQKDAVHRFHTVMRFTRKVAGKGRVKTFTRKITMVKDRDREDIWEEEAGQGMTLELQSGPKFAFDYLTKIAGWELGKA